MVKDFMKNKPLDKLVGNSEPKNEVNDNKPVKQTEEETTNNINNTMAADKPTKKKVGRPKVKTEEETLINIAVPLSVYEKMNIAKACYGGNLTKYVNSVIAKDLQENYSEYLAINNRLNKF